MNGAGIIIENERGEILLGRRCDNDCWKHAGGSTELGESCEETARRELFEEMGLIANTLELLGVFSGKDTHCIYQIITESKNAIEAWKVLPLLKYPLNRIPRISAQAMMKP